MAARFGAVFLLFLCLVPAREAAADELLTEQQILRLFPGTFHAVIKGKYQATVTVQRGGAIAGEMAGLQDQGRWTVRGDQLCIVMPSMTRGRVECSEVVADGGWYRGRNVAFRRL